jgi:hypothetical protein
MGYYTDYHLTIEPDDAYPEVNEALQAETDFLGAFEPFADGWYLHATWYDREIDLRKFSLAFPDTLFILSGVGEESPDAWKFYVKNGKGFRAQGLLTYPSFDEGKLK